MNTADLLIMQLQFARSRSISLWKSFSDAFLFSYDDATGIQPIEVIRKTLESDFVHLHNILRRGNTGAGENPLSRPGIESIEDELRWVQPFREKLLQLIYSFPHDAFADLSISCKGGGTGICLANYISRMIQHENELAGELRLQQQIFTGKNKLAA